MLGSGTCAHVIATPITSLIIFQTPQHISPFYSFTYHFNHRRERKKTSCQKTTKCKLIPVNPVAAAEEDEATVVEVGDADAGEGAVDAVAVPRLATIVVR
jgi:hypothetical protein